jgi:hypothetical protein
MAERWEIEGLGRSDEGDVVGERRKRCDAERPLFRDRGLADRARPYWETRGCVEHQEFHRAGRAVVIYGSYLYRIG